ncbi:MAG: hypothetical protein ACRD12_10150, partial [Acidimicrobiales bacterium]
RSDPSVYGLYVDFDASGSTAMAGNFILNGDLSLRARLNGWQERGVAVNAAGTTGYRIRDDWGGQVDVVDLSDGSVERFIPMPEWPGAFEAEATITPDGAWLLTPTAHGISFVSLRAAPETPWSAWAHAAPPFARLDGLGTWMVPVDDPVAAPGQTPPSYLYAQMVGFTNDPAIGLIGLVKGPSGKYAQLAVRHGDGHWDSVAIPFHWQANRFYFPLVYEVGPGTWGGWVYDHTAATWSPIGTIQLSPNAGKLRTQSFTTVVWTGPTVAGCAELSRADVLMHPPIGYYGGWTTTVGTPDGWGEHPGGCPAEMSTVADVWTRYEVGQ